MSPAHRFRSFYDLAPLRERLRRFVDFGRLNSGEVRFSVATTDLESGETIVFDTAKGARIEVDHLLASAGYLPEFAPVEIDGRLAYALESSAAPMDTRSRACALTVVRCRPGGTQR